MGLSIIIPTMGRSTLRRAMSSVLRQPDFRPAEDELIVVADRPVALPGEADYPWVRCEEIAGPSPLGALAREHGSRIARGTHLVFLDDDDIMSENVLGTIRQEALASPTIPIIFRLRIHGSKVIWEEPCCIRSWAGTPMCVEPRDPQKQQGWQAPERSDWHHISRTILAFGGARFHALVVCEVAHRHSMIDPRFDWVGS
jgi:hypothetical protein